MFDSYKTIFDQRGESYHQAMIRYPRARAEEFQSLLALLNLQPGDTVVDLPAGGCYLKHFAPADITIYSIDPTQSMLRHGAEQDHGIYAEIDQTPLKTSAVDKVFSLAGIHHLADKRPFYREACRILRPGGLLGLADVMAGSAVDRFLNGFVDQFNSMGHQGVFLDRATVNQLADCGFAVRYRAVRSYCWRFECEDHLTDFFRLLFGLDKATDKNILTGVQDILGCESRDGQLCVPWELYHLLGQKA